jgi:hypothetical protein
LRTKAPERVDTYQAFWEAYESKLSDTELTRVRERVERAIEQSTQLSAQVEAQPLVVCRLRDTGRVDCISLATLLSYFDADMTVTIVEDIDKLYQVLDLDHRDEILIGCGPGIWGAAGLEDFDAVDETQFFDELTGGTGNLFQAMCLKFAAAIAAASPSLSGPGGFSGITGFDPLA